MPRTKKRQAINFSKTLVNISVLDLHLEQMSNRSARLFAGATSLPETTACRGELAFSAHGPTTTVDDDSNGNRLTEYIAAHSLNGSIDPDHYTAWLDFQLRQGSTHRSRFLELYAIRTHELRSCFPAISL